MKLGRLGDPEGASALVTALADLDPGVRASAARSLGPVARSGSEEMGSLAKALEDPSGAVRIQAALALGRRRDPGTAGSLVRALAGDSDARVRAELSRALGEIGGRVALAGLRQAASDTDARVRAASLEALARAAGLEAAEEFQRALADPALRVRLVAARALSERPDVLMAPVLAKALEDATPGDGVGHAVAIGLVKIRGRAAVAGLAKVARMFRGDLRRRAVFALGEIGAAASRGVLVSLLDDDDVELRRLAAIALGSGLHREACDALVRALGDRSGDVRREAAYSLAAYRRAEGAELLVEDIRAGPRRARAIDTLAWVGEPAADALEKLAGDPAERVEARIAAIIALTDLGLARSVPVIEKSLESDSGELRAAAALALGEIADPRALGPVWRIVDDRDRRVRMCAAYAAARLGNDSRLAGIGSELMTGSGPARNMAARLLSRVEGERAARMLLVGLEAPQPGVRAVSARGLGRKGLKSPEAVRALSTRARDPDPLVRRAAAAALGAIATPSSVRELAGFVRDADLGVRLATFGAVAEAGLGEGAAAAARGLGDPRIEARAAAVRALGRVTKEAFGLATGRAPTDEELRSAVLKAQLWWSEHRGRFESGDE